MSVQFLMKDGKVAFTTDYGTLILDAQRRVETALPAKRAQAQKRLDRLIRVAQR